MAKLTVYNIQALIQHSFTPVLHPIDYQALTKGRKEF